MLAAGSETARSTPPPAGSAAERLGLIAFALAAAVLTGYLAASDPAFLHFDLSDPAATLVGVAAALALAVLALRRPEWGLALLVGFVYLNLSQVLVRWHDLPSLLPLLAVGLVAGARRWGDARGLGRRLLCAPSLLLAGYVLALLISSTYARSSELADERLLETAKAAAVYALVLLLAGSRAALWRGVWALLASGSLLALLALVQIASGAFGEQFGGLARVKYAHIYGRVFEPRIAGPLGDPNFFAQILVMLVPLALFAAWEARGRAPRAWAYAVTAILVAASVFTYSRGGALALAVVLALSLGARRVRPAQAVAGAAAVVVLWLLLPADFTRRLSTLEEVLPGGDADVIRPDSSFEKRKLLTQVAWHMFLDHPLRGVGTGNYTEHFEVYAESVGSFSREYEEPDERHYPHSLYLEIAAETGLPGLGLFGASLAAVLLALLRARARFTRLGDAASAHLAQAFVLAVVGYLVCALFLHNHFPRYLWMLLGLATALERVSVESAREAGGVG